MLRRVLLVTDLIKLLGYPLGTNNSVIRLSDSFCDTESVEHLIALFTSPMTIARLEEIDPWLSHARCNTPTMNGLYIEGRRKYFGMRI
jgi:hypothetical protein